MYFVLLVTFSVLPSVCVLDSLDYIDGEGDYELSPILYNEIDELLRHKHTQPPPKPATTKPTTTKTTTTVWRDLVKSFFQSLESYEVQTIPATEAKYPWIAKVVHSKSQPYPYVCTAVCIEPRVFITAARCLFSLKVSVTSVFYDKKKFAVKVFVLPSLPTKQWFDDIGFILTQEGNGYNGKWPSIKYTNIKRTDNQFQWFYDLNYAKEVHHRVIGYVTKKFIHVMKKPETEFRLTELNVVIDIRMCEAIMTKNVIKGFFVPCYHSCNITDFLKKAPSCQKYHGTEGGAVINYKSNTLLGLATWGTYTNLYELPVGFAVPNSRSFFNDLHCIHKIKNDKTNTNNRGYYKTLCLK